MNPPSSLFFPFHFVSCRRLFMPMMIGFALLCHLLLLILHCTAIEIEGGMIYFFNRVEIDN